MTEIAVVIDKAYDDIGILWDCISQELVDKKKKHNPSWTTVEDLCVVRSLLKEILKTLMADLSEKSSSKAIEDHLDDMIS